MFGFLKDSFAINLKKRCWEYLFFLFFIVSSYLKFYNLENEITPSITRSYAMIAAVWGIILCLAAILSLFPRKIRPFAVIAVSLLLSLLVVTDMLYMRYYADMFAFLNIMLASQVMEIGSSVLALLQARDLLWFLDTPLLAGYLVVARRLSADPLFKRLTVRRALLSLLVFCAGAFALSNHLSIYNRKVPGALSSMWNRPAVSNNVGVAVYHVVDAWNTAKGIAGKGKVSDEDVREIAGWFSNRNAAERDSHMFGAARGKNLIVVQVESLQNFVVGLKLNGREVTPNINKFLKESVYFSRNYSQTGSGNSSDAELLCNTGLFPVSAGAVFTRFAANKFEALPKLLADNGYSTLALHGDRPGFWNRNSMYRALGFQRYVSRPDFEEDEVIGMGISDKSFFRQSLEILASEQQPFYAFLVTLTSHHPFNYPPMLEQAGFDTGALNGCFMGDYLAAMHYMDKQLGWFIEGLRKKGLLDSSIIVIYGDHAAVPPSSRPQLEQLVGRSLSESWAWRSINEVPLLVRLPGDKKITYIERKATGIIDVPVTVSALLGLRYDVSFGSSLFAKRGDEPVIFHKGSYIVGDAYVEPALGRATNIENGSALNYADFTELTRETNKRLVYSGKILDTVS